MPPRTVIAALALAATCLAGCTPAAAPASTPATSPTYLCVPEAGGSAQPCGPIEHEQAQKRDALYAEAEQVFRRYWAEMDRLTLEKAPAFTPVLQETTADKFRGYVEDDLDQALHQERVQGEAKVVRIDRLPVLSRDGSTAALLTCVDARTAMYVTNEGDTPSPGTVYELRLYFSPRDDHLKIVNSESRDVSEC